MWERTVLITPKTLKNLCTRSSSAMLLGLGFSPLKHWLAAAFKTGRRRFLCLVSPHLILRLGPHFIRVALTERPRGRSPS